jgi:hypothetical protein
MGRTVRVAWAPASRCIAGGVPGVRSCTGKATQYRGARGASKQ